MVEGREGERKGDGKGRRGRIKRRGISSMNLRGIDASVECHSATTSVLAFLKAKVKAALRWSAGGVLVSLS